MTVQRVIIGAEKLPVGSIGASAPGWWGIIAGIVTEAALFGYLLFSYVYLAAQPHTSAWPSELPSLSLAVPNTVILLLSSVAVWVGERAVRQNKPRTQLIGLSAGTLLGLIFVGVQLVEWKSKPFTLASGSYGSLFFTITGFHMAHVIAGLLMLAALTVWSYRNYFDATRHAAISIGAIYWHFVDAVWLAVFFTLYLTPYMRA